MSAVTLLRTINPGAGALKAVAWSPDSSRLATGGSNGDVSVWSTDGRCLWHVEGYSEKIATITWSPDGELVAYGTVGAGASVAICFACDGRMLLRKSNEANTWALGWSHDAARMLLATGPGNDYSSAQVFVVRTGEPLFDLVGHTTWIDSAAWSPSGTYLATGSEDRTVRVWRALDGQCVQVLEAHQGKVFGLAWSKDGARLLSGSDDRTLRVWDPLSGTCMKCWEVLHPIEQTVSWAEVAGLVCAGRGHRIYSDSQGRGSHISIWSGIDGQLISNIDGHDDDVMQAEFSPDGTRLASVSHDGTLRIWDVSGLRRRVETAGTPSAARYVHRQAHSVGRLVAAEANEREMWVPIGLEHQAAMADPRCVGSFVTESGDRLPSLAVHPEGRLLATGSGDGHVRLWDLATGATRWQGQATHADGVVDLAFAPDGQTLASAGADASIRLWSTVTGCDEGQLNGHRDVVTSQSWSPDGAGLASASKDGSIRVWDVNGMRESGCLLTGDQTMWSVAWSADGELLATGGNGVLRVLDVRSGRTVHDLQTGASLDGVAWSPGGGTFASAARERIHLWDRRSGEQINSWRSHEGEWATPAAWSPDGRLLASCPNHRESEGLDPGVGLRIWEAESGRLVACLPFPERDSWRVAWSPDGGFIASSHSSGPEDVFRIWDVREFMTDGAFWGAPAASTAGGPTPALAAALRPLPAALAQLAAMNLAAPLSWVLQLDALLGADTEDLPAPVHALRQHAGVRGLRQLRWPRPARLGLMALLLRGLPLQDWAPPAALTPSRLRQALEVALAGPECPPQAPDLPVAALLVAAQSIDDRQLALLTLLGADAVASDPALPLRLARDVPKLPPMALQQRKLLGRRLRLDEGSQVQGSGAGTEHAGIALQGDFRSLLPSQLLLPQDLFESRYLRHELLFRARSGHEPPRLRPTVLVLDVTAPCFGPVEDVTRLAAHVVAATLIQRGLPVVLVTTGGAGTVQALSRPADLLAIWTRRSLEPLQLRASLATARAMGHTLNNGALQPPAVLLLTHAWFGTDEPSPPDTEDLRALFVQYPKQDIAPPFAAQCSRWRSLPHQGAQDNIEVVMGDLLA